MVKIGSPPNYFVQVFPVAWDFPPEKAALYDGIFTVLLNITLGVVFVPDVSGIEPPWPPDQDPPEGEFTTLAQVRWYQLLAETYAVTPNAALAGRAEKTGTSEYPTNIFYVDPDEFAEFTRELTALGEIASNTIPERTRDNLIDRSVIRFIDDRTLGSPLLEPIHARTVGRGPQA